MTTDDRIHVQIVLDRSGSMDPIASATVDALNGFLSKQRAVPGKLHISLADFDSQEPFRVVLDALPLAEVGDLESHQFQPRGATPLLDAVGRAVEVLDARSVENPDEDQVLVILTDGLENASTDYDAPTISNLLDARQEAGWAVLFLGANQDSFETGDSMSMKPGNIRNFEASDPGVHAAMSMASSSLIEHRGRSRRDRRTRKDELLDEQDERRRRS